MTLPVFALWFNSYPNYHSWLPTLEFSTQAQITQPS